MASGETLVLFLSLYKMQALLPTEEGLRLEKIHQKVVPN